MTAQTLRNAVPEGALQIAVDVGRWCSGWASGVLSAVDRWLPGQASHSSAQAVITQTLRKGAGARVRRRCSPPMWVGDVVAGEVAYWVLWIADCLVRLATRLTRAPKP